MSTLEERVAVIEANAIHARDEVVKMSAKVDEMYDVITALKGVRWALIGVAAIAGFVAGKFGAIAAFFTAKVP